MENLIFFALGSAVSFGISYYYFKRSSQEKPEWFSTKNVKDILTKHPEDIEWTAKQIIDLYNNKVFNWSDDSDPLPYNFCPECGSERLERYGVSNIDSHLFVIKCKDCDWSNHTE